MPEFRTGTHDDIVWRDVVARNEYRLPDRFGPSAKVLDIGGHIGAFVHAAVSRGAALVHSYEAHPDNFRMLMCNCRSMNDRVRVHQAAVWRSDGETRELFMKPLSDRTGSVSLFHATPKDLRIGRVVPLDSILKEMTADGKDVSLMKIDVEGAEYPILFTSRLLSRVREICGEYHRFGRPEWAGVDGFPVYDWPALGKHLKGQGFRVEFLHVHPKVGLFFAKRPG